MKKARNESNICFHFQYFTHIQGFPRFIGRFQSIFGEFPYLFGAFPRFFGHFPEFFGPIVLISNRKIPINYGNEPKIYGIRPKNRGNAPKNHGNWSINREKPCKSSTYYVQWNTVFAFNSIKTTIIKSRPFAETTHFPIQSSSNVSITPRTAFALPRKERKHTVHCGFPRKNNGKCSCNHVARTSSSSGLPINGTHYQGLRQRRHHLCCVCDCINIYYNFPVARFAKFPSH